MTGGVVAHYKASFLFFDRPRWREEDQDLGGRREGISENDGCGDRFSLGRTSSDARGREQRKFLVAVLQGLASHCIARPQPHKKRNRCGQRQPRRPSNVFPKSGNVRGRSGGIVQMLRLLKGNNPSPMVCVPDEATKEQSVRAVVNSLEQHPEVLHEDFSTLVVAVTSVTWPCHK
jgi:hypothetical protein